MNSNQLHIRIYIYAYNQIIYVLFKKHVNIIMKKDVENVLIFFIKSKLHNDSVKFKFNII